MKDGMIQMLCKKHLIVFSIFVILIMIVCTGCGSKSPITTTDFISTMESQDFYIKDIMDQYAEYEVFTSATLAVNPTNEYQIEFYTFVDDNMAKDSYSVTKKNQIEPYEEGSSSNVSVNTDKYSKCAVTANGQYMFISRIDNTMVYIKAPDSYKDEVKKLIDKLGY